ncbi:helix-turn-helix transcriptional regulator [Crenothrix polyspora]|uniref:Prophage CP4-57 regulatory n=1 Tax=Crenothrix polyspora TaxID=360316 RepID=A0A1R4HEK4_9GAMM|nr:DNA-binding protein [Crenothrix polyspora]SJM94637.1 Prophage CP4-57 regulatory [Crenothrix polyspora]
MVDYDFTLKFDISSLECEPDTFLDQLYEAGCDDAIIGIGRPGRLSINFTREAKNASEAVLSALNDVKRALPQAKLIEATPDFVGLTDIADILGCSRQNIRNLHIKYQSSFPTPVHEGSTTLWHLAKVLPWFKGKGNYAVEDSLLEISLTNMKINLDRQMGDIYTVHF